MLNRLLDSGPRGGSPARALAGLSISFGAHALALSGLLLGTLVAVGSVNRPPRPPGAPELLQLVVQARPAAKAAAPPPRSARSPQPEARVRERSSAEQVQPVTVPDALTAPEPDEEPWVDDEIYDDAGAEGGLPGGIPGGIPGGSRDGVPGGDPNGVPGGFTDGTGRGAGALPGLDEAVPLVGEIRAPERIRMVLPDYPRAAREARLEGQVHLEVVIGRSGVVEKVTVLKGHLLFREAAAEAVRRWRYRPALQAGRPVKVYMTVVVEFRLN